LRQRGSRNCRAQLDVA